MSAEQMRQALSMAAKVARRELAFKRAESALCEALSNLNDAKHNTYDQDMQANLRLCLGNTEKSEAWIVYLQNPSIIDEPERNLPA